MNIEKNIKYKDAEVFAEALRNGFSADQMKADFDANLKRAQEIIAAEQEEKKRKAEEAAAKNAKLDKTREGAVVAVLSYLMELNLISKEKADNTFFQKVLNAVKNAETNLKVQSTDNFFEALFTMPSGDLRFFNKYADGVIRRFVRDL